jgi:type IV secretory pathway VirJ component
VGLSSLRYFYQPRTPDLTAHVVTQTLRHYLAAWHGNQIVLIGYSFGADLMPFIVNRLPQDLRERLISVNLLGLGTDASFEVPVGKWIHGAAGQPMPVAPELSRMGDVPVLCVYGEGESESLCPSLAQPTVAKVRVGSGHHFSNEYGTLAEKIADFAARAQTLHGGR